MSIVLSLAAAVVIAPAPTRSAVDSSAETPSPGGAAAPVPSPKPRRTALQLDIATTFEPRGSASSISPVEGELQIALLGDGTVIGLFRQFHRKNDDGTTAGGSYPLRGSYTGSRVYFDVDSGARQFHVDASLHPTPGGEELYGNARIDTVDCTILSDPCQPPSGGVSPLCS